MRSVGPQLALGGRSTHAFSTEFTAQGDGRTAYEAQAANGDSGGAVFVWDPEAGWALGGIMMAITTWAGQPSRAAISGNVTYAAELSAYREAILEVVQGGAGATWAGRRCGLLGAEPLALVGWCWALRRRRRDGARMHEGGR